MDRRISRMLTMSAVALICLVLVTVPVPAAQRDPLKAASIALDAHLVTAVHLEGFGATYGEDGRRVPLESYRADLDVARDDAMSTPQGFLKAARAAKASTREVPQGTEVSFTAGGRTFIGLITAGNEVDRVHAAATGSSRRCFATTRRRRAACGSRRTSRETTATSRRSTCGCRRWRWTPNRGFKGGGP
jgi:hypothetical protein